jgi:alanyl-tRNA synthetase
MGAMALFGEKYGDKVRAIQFDTSIELCGGTHVQSTGAIGLFRITSESSVASGIRRIEAVSSTAAYELDRRDREILNSLAQLLKQPKDVLKSVEQLSIQLEKAEKELKALDQSNAEEVYKSWDNYFEERNGLKLLIRREDIDAGQLKNLLFRLKGQTKMFAAVGGVKDGKPHLTVFISEDLVKERDWNASILVRNWAKAIKGGGGGQPFLATAGGKDSEGLSQLLTDIKQWTIDNA